MVYSIILHESLRNIQYIYYMHLKHGFGIKINKLGPNSFEIHLFELPYDNTSYAMFIVNPDGVFII